MASTDEERKEVSFRKRVLTAIETLTEVENISELQTHLQYLHNLAWDEVIEERFLSKQCGFPTCSQIPPQKKRNQLYQIDKKEKKIYEFCKQRSKFCSEQCYHKSVFIRNQLEEQPLWITGYCEQRMKKKFELPDKTFASPKNETETASEPDPESIEFVTDTIIAKVKGMKLKEEYEEPKVADEEEAELQPYKLTDDDKDFIRSIRQFKATNFGAPSAVPKKQSAKTKLTAINQKKEEEILERLRAKYGNKNAKQKKPPVIIEAQPLIQRASVEEQSKKTVQWKDTWLTDLIKSWFTPETRQMIREGARPVGGAAEQILMDFLSGKKVESTVNLPNLDKYNVREKRLNIYLQSVRNHWLELEALLHVTPTRRDLLSRVAATFNLNSENIAGWNKREINQIVLALFLTVSLIDVELGDEYFKKEHVSHELSAAAYDICGLHPHDITCLYTFIKSESSCQI
ncbi:unnamed protein product [Caenorhabditis sp. 36 PRJEB53466]|nr:unnamed protein product [Caenorhabditis sp. 36 PRJEB53466]